MPNIKALLLALLFTAAGGGCGIKGPPLPPESGFPAAVSDLRAWPREGSVLLGWSPPGRNVDGSKLEDLLGFKVFRQDRALDPRACPECPLNFKVVAEIDMDYPRGARVEAGRVLWQDRRVEPRTEYTYFVRAYNSRRSPGPESNRLKLSWDAVPPAPGEVEVKSENRALELTWKASPAGEAGFPGAGFNLYRRMEGEPFGLVPLTPEPVRQTRFVDGGLQNGKKYFYEVRAVRDFRGTRMESPPSAAAEGIPEKQTPPAPPTGLVAAFQEGGVALRWNENPEPDIAGYDVYRRAQGEEAFARLNPQPVREPYFLDRRADPAKAYVYRLKAVDSSPSRKESAFSQDAEVFPLPKKP